MVDTSTRPSDEWEMRGSKTALRRRRNARNVLGVSEKKCKKGRRVSRRRISIFLCVARVLVNAGVSGLRATCRERTGPQKRNKQTAGASQAVRRLSTHTRPSEQPSPRFYEPNPSHFSLHYFSFGSDTLLLFASLDLKAKQSTRRFSPQNKARSRPMLR